jgi:hypothetical protein
MLTSLIASALRFAPTFANEDGDLLFSHLVADFPDAATDAIDLVVSRVCVAATSGKFTSLKANGLATDILNEISPWGDLTVVWA